MKKKLINFLKTFLVPAAITITCGWIAFFFTYIVFDDRRRLFSDKRFVHTAIIVSICLGVILGTIYYVCIFVFRKSNQGYSQMDIWLNEIKKTEDVFELESYVETLKNYKQSSFCPSIEHVQYANGIISIAKIKIDTIKKLENEKRNSI